MRALPDDATAEEVSSTLRAAWAGAVEKAVRERANGGLGEDMMATVLRAAVAESERDGELGAPAGRGPMRPGPWVGGGYGGHAMISEPALRGDPLTRTLLRYDEWEGGKAIYTAAGVKVSIDDETQATLRRDSAGGETWWAVASTLLPLHYYHHFTKAAFTDGSLADPRRKGGRGRRRVAYGVWEGVLPEDEVPEPRVGWGSLTADERVEACMAHGMWGGACPPDWEIGEAETYAIFKYLERVANTSPRPAEERVLVVSDSQTTLDKLEEAWRVGDARECAGGSGVRGTGKAGQGDNGVLPGAPRGGRQRGG